MIYLLLAMGVGLTLASFLEDDDDDPDLLLDEYEETITGTGGDDIITADQDQRHLGRVEIRSGAGDDLIDLVGPEYREGRWDHSYEQPGYDASVSTVSIWGTIDAGAGNDTINAYFEGDVLHGGEGDDHILVEGYLEDGIHGDAGNDYIKIFSGPGDPAYVYGGTGNDTIDGTDETNAYLYGGEGDDLLLGSSGGNGGDGYASVLIGGEGDDILRFNLVTDYGNSSYLDNQAATGGQGADRFEISFDEGALSLSTDEPYNGYGPAAGDTEPRLIYKGLELRDFTPGEDTLVLDAAPTDPRFTLTSIEVVEVEEERYGRVVSITPMIRTTYETDDPELVDHHVFFEMDVPGFSWDDVELVGADRSLLVPIAT